MDEKMKRIEEYYEAIEEAREALREADEAPEEMWIPEDPEDDADWIMIF